MQIAELILIAVGLSMDAFAVSITKGLEMQRVRTRYAVLTGAWFGFFQALMPVIGYFLGSRFREQIEALSRQLAQAEGVNERLKASDQMLWVQQMNSIRNRAEEIVVRDLIYS